MELACKEKGFQFEAGPAQRIQGRSIKPNPEDYGPKLRDAPGRATSFKNLDLTAQSEFAPLSLRLPVADEKALDSDSELRERGS